MRSLRTERGFGRCYGRMGAGWVTSWRGDGGWIPASVFTRAGSSQEKRVGLGGSGGDLRRATTRSLFQKSDTSENWAFWIPAFAGMTDLEVIFHALARKVV